MMKRLLFSALSVLFAFSANAAVSDYVYTPQGRFKITNETNLMGKAGSFANLDGWTVATTDTTGARQLADNFEVGKEEGDGGLNYAKSVVNTVGEGMKYTNSTLDASATYVISFKLRNAVEAAPAVPLSTALSSTLAGANVIAITGTTGGDTPETVTYNKPTEISTDWITYSYAIVGDGTARTLAISFTAMNTNVQIADIQIRQAQQVADDRDAKVKADYILSIYNLTDWSQFDDEDNNNFPAEDLIIAYGQVAKITEDMRAYLIDIAEYAEEDIPAACPGFTEDLTTYNKQISKYNEVFNKFISGTMTAFIDVTKDSNGEHLGIYTGKKIQKASSLGGWTVVSPGARGFWNDGPQYPELGHFSGSQGGLGEMELSKKFTLFEGGYTFKADMVAYARPSTSSSDWGMDLGQVSADGFVYVTDANNNVVASSDTVGLERDYSGSDWTTKYVTFSVPAYGEYTMHIKSIRRFANRGGSMVVRYPELYGKSFGKYSTDEQIYINAVQGQITAGDKAYQVALDSIASEATPWGKVTLQNCVDTMSVKKQKYDAIFTDSVAIVATYDKATYVAEPTNPESQMVYEVYSEYVRDLLAANRKYVAVNDTLKMLSNKINAAEGLAALSIYQVSTGLAALEAEIATAKQLDATLRADDYSEENAKSIVDEVAALETAMINCNNSIDPAKLTKVYADIDFEYTSELYDNLVGYTDEMAPATIVGKVGALEVTQFKKDNVTTASNGTSNDFPYQLGIDIDGQKQYAGYLRAGCSDATVNINTSDLGQNILLVSMDWWFSVLGDLYSGFEVLDEDANVIAGFVVCPNDNKAKSNTFNIDPVNQYYNATNKNDAEILVDAYHSQWTAVLDFANGKQYLIGKVGSKTIFSDPVDMNVTGAPATFKIAGSIGKNKYPGRRSWFDNLKIQKLEIAPSGGLKGDANNDGRVSIADVTTIAAYLLGDTPESFSPENADANGDGRISIADVTTVATMLLNEE